MFYRAQNPLLSVIIPIYNAESSICRCVESVLSQTLEEIELILVNDGSCDCSEQLCASYTNDKRVHLINKVNGGVSSARNKGIEESKGKYITFLDADDFLNPDTCELLVNLMEKNNSDYCIASFNLIVENRLKSQCLPSIDIRNKSYNIEEFRKIFEELYSHNLFNSPWAKCYKRELILTQFDNRYSLGEDLLFNLEYLRKCKSVYISGEAVYNYCFLQNNSLSNNFSFVSLDSIVGVYSESKIILTNLWGGNVWPIPSVDKKYISDFVTLIDRWIRIEKPNAQKLKEAISRYQVKNVFSNISIKKMSKKNDIGRILILHDRYFALKIMSLITSYGK